MILWIFVGQFFLALSKLSMDVATLVLYGGGWYVKNILCTCNYADSEWLRCEQYMSVWFLRLPLSTLISFSHHIAVYWEFNTNQPYLSDYSVQLKNIPRMPNSRDSFWDDENMCMCGWVDVFPSVLHSMRFFLFSACSDHFQVNTPLCSYAMVCGCL